MADGPLAGPPAPPPRDPHLTLLTPTCNRIPGRRYPVDIMYTKAPEVGSVCVCGGGGTWGGGWVEWAVWGVGWGVECRGRRCMCAGVYVYVVSVQHHAHQGTLGGFGWLASWMGGCGVRCL